MSLSHMVFERFEILKAHRWLAVRATKDEVIPDNNNFLLLLLVFLNYMVEELHLVVAVAILFFASLACLLPVARLFVLRLI